MPDEINTSTDHVSEPEVADPIYDDWLYFNEDHQTCHECGMPLIDGDCLTCAADRKLLAEIQFNGQVRF